MVALFFQGLYEYLGNARCLAVHPSFEATQGTEAVTVNGFQGLKGGDNQPAPKNLAGQLLLAEFHLAAT